jgi:membrane protein
MLHDAQTMGAALAYYTVLSMAPLLIIAVAVAGRVFGSQAAEGMLAAEIQDLVGTAGAQVIQSILVSAYSPAKGIVAGVLGIGALLFGAASVFNQLRIALNRIWDVAPAPFRLRDFLSEQLRSFALVVGVGVLLLLLLIANAILSSVAAPLASLWIANTLGSLAVIIILFALLYRLVPATRIPWSDVWIGAAASAFLFALGKHLVGAYLGRASIGSAYGAAGSLVVLLVWVYYSAQIFLFGAEFTHIYAFRKGSRRPRRPVS